MTCEACTTAKLRSCGSYRTWCDGCMARACARSLAAFNALDPKGSGEQEPLRDLVAQVFPAEKRKQARADVWAWWQIDHPTTEGVTA